MNKHVDLIVLKGGVYLYPGSEIPTNGPSGTLAGKAAPSSLYFYDGAIYYNGGTKASPSWINIAAITPGEIGLTDGKILIGGADGLAAAKTPTGDVTISNAGVTTIAAKVVSLAKLADIATDHLIGRDTAASGVPETIGVGGGLEFDGSGNVRVADKGITLAKHADMATDSLIGRDTAAAGAPEVIALGSGLEMSGSGALQVATAGVSKAMLANIGTDRLLGRDTASAGVPEEIALGAGLEFDGSGNIRIADSGVTAGKLAAGAVFDFSDVQNATVVAVDHADSFPKTLLASDASNDRLVLVMVTVTEALPAGTNLGIGY